MPTFSYSDLPAWLQLIVAVTIILGLIGTVVVLSRKFFPWLKKRIRTTDAISDLPDFMADVRKTLAAQDNALALLKHEVLPNNGGSLRDAVDRQGRTLEAHGRSIRGIDKKLAKDRATIQILLNEKENKDE